MVASLVLGVVAIRRRDFVVHSAWMTRGYAIGVAAGTQALVFLPWMLLVGPTDEPTRAMLMGAAWVINLAVAELVIGGGVGRAIRSKTEPPCSGRQGSVGARSRAASGPARPSSRHRRPAG